MVEVAPNQEAVIEKKTRSAGRFLEARKKSSRFFIFLEKRKLANRTRAK
jgi:hypothetical protein